MLKRNYFRRLATLMLAMLMCLSCLTVGASAEETTVDVRVNGYLVNFPDQKPYINKDGRTLIPVRFVAENLGAAVEWDQKTKTATISKDGVVIELPIGSSQMKVTENGSTNTVVMDTEAVLTGNRTMVPIRFVAEALGAWVGYSNTYHTVQISNGELSPEEIEELHAIPFGWNFDKSKTTFKNSGSTIEDLHEYIMRPYDTMLEFTILNKYDMQKWDSTKDTKEELANLYARYIPEAVSRSYTHESSGVTAEFRTDVTCLFSQPTSYAQSPFLCYGYLTLTLADDANVAKYKDRFDGSDFGNIQPGGTYTYIIEVQYELSMMGGPMGGHLINRTNGQRDFWR